MVGHRLIRLYQSGINSDKVRAHVWLKGFEEEGLLGLGSGQKLGMLEINQPQDNIKNTF